MKEKNKTNNLIDTRGYSCPISVAKIAKVMNDAEEGSIIEIVSDDLTIPKEIEQWCFESGNSMNNVIIDGSTVRIEVIKGSGYKPQTLFDLISFFLLGVKLHIRKFFVSLFKKDTTKYLITFVSVAEGMRAHYWLTNNYPHIEYVLLPVPNDITRHCGVVMGLANSTKAKELFELLQKNGFKVEDIYTRDNYTYRSVE